MVRVISSGIYCATSASLIDLPSNCVDLDAPTRLAANYYLRLKPGSNLDFVGIDLYGYSAENMHKPFATMYLAGNYLMICESGAEVLNAAGPFRFY